MTELSRIQRLAKLPKEERLRIINEIAPSDYEKQLLLTSWGFLARPSQIEPFEKEYKCLLYLAGRGYGKSMTLSNWAIHKARKHKGAIIGIIGQTVNDVRNVMVDGSPSSILKQAPIDFMPEYTPTQRKLVFPNGSVGFTFSGDSPDSLRGFNLDFCIVDELVKFKYPQDTIDNMLLALRRGKNPQWACATTPKPSQILRNLIAQSDTFTVRGKTKDNRANLPESYLSALEEKYSGTRLYAQEVEGILLDDIEGALWSYSDITKAQISLEQAPEEYADIVISIDPAVTTKKTSDATGIVVVGFANNQCYVLEDATDKLTPAELAAKIHYLSGYYQTTKILVETNQGGDFIKTVLNASTEESQPLNIIEVYAKRSKYVRAEGIYGYYEQQRVFHVGNFHQLELEMISYTSDTKKSPDRLDALVHALTYLFPNESDKPKVRLIDLPW